MKKTIRKAGSLSLVPIVLTLVFTKETTPEDFASQVEKELESVRNGNINKDEFKTELEKGFETIIAEKTKLVTDNVEKLEKEIETLTGIVKTQGEALAKGNTNVQATKMQLLVAEIEEQKEALIASATKKSDNHEFTIKADTLRASVVGNPNALDLTDIGQLAYRKLSVYDSFRKVPVPKDKNGVVRYVDWNPATTVRAAAAVAEGTDFPASTAKWATYTLNLEKIGDMIPMSAEFMYDASMFAAELENFLQVNVAIKVDTDLVTGDGATPNINGMKAQIPNYVPAAAGIVDASIYDLIVKLRESISAAGGSKYDVNTAWMNIVDINKMKLKKDANFNYILPPFIDKSGMVVDGVTIIEANAFAANTMAIGDNRYGAIYEEAGITVESGYATGDFESDMMTIKARRRLNLLIRNVDRTGFLEVTSISAALTTLAT